MTVIAIPQILQEKLTPAGAEALVEILNKSGDRSEEHILEVAENKFERRLAEEAGILRTEVANTRASIIKWMFIFWAGQVATITGILFAFFKK